MKDLDPKSLIIGLLTASVVGLVVALIQPKEETKESEVGRYVVSGNDGKIWEVRVFDTVTGAMWSQLDPVINPIDRFSPYTNAYNVKLILPIK